MPTYIKSKIPWWKILSIFLIIILAVIAVCYVVPSVGAWIGAGFAWAGAGLYAFFIGSPSIYTVAVIVVIFVVGIVLISARKYIFKQKISNSSAMQTAPPQLQSALINTAPLGPTPAPAQIITDSTKEVTTTA